MLFLCVCVQALGKLQVSGRQLRFRGERVLWVQPASLQELLDFKAQYPNAKLVVGNTEVGESHTCTPIHSQVHTRHT